MKNIFLLFCTILITSVSIAQRSAGPTRFSSQNPFWELKNRWIEINEANIAMGEAPNSIENVEGSPYSPVNFISGKIYSNGQNSIEHVFLRYNMLSDEIEIKNSAYDTSNTKAVIKDPEIYAQVGNTTYIFAPYRGSNEKGGYFAFLKAGSYYDLYKKSKVKFIPFKTTTAYSGSQAARFEKTNQYYMVNKAGNFFKLPTSKNKLLKVMDEYKEELGAFIDSKKITFQTEQDILAVFTYYNTLLAKAE
jgi:hypothetical protein